MASYNYNNLDLILIQSLISLNHNQTGFTSQQQPQPQKPATSITNNNAQRSQIHKEEAQIEREIIQAITRGKLESLKPNSGQSISIGEHYVCVSFHEEIESDCRVWEWHGHVVSYNEECGYTQEYVCGSYFERMLKKVVYDESEEEKEQESNFGSRKFIGGLNLMDGRVFCRNFTDN
ncbi:hypothetical protein Patl1_30867 [Pistacia atlantica]|uniref:Uncharacterized protein n=1 Tax=Pistacia atlantica TaxID=434234 RepID=A0ACC1AF38_9ROSI|nr:hypothetical protein Patl1_30867 [Pistacia atlantica]